jgi:MHS family proline/betaine transporter-like MFS transporter
VFIRAMLTDEQLVEWGWRLPFLSGILIAFVSMYLDTHGKEHNPNVGGRIVDNDDDESDTKKGESTHSLGEVFKSENLPALASATLTPMLYGAGFYTSELRKSDGIS